MVLENSEQLRNMGLSLSAWYSPAVALMEVRQNEESCAGCLAGDFPIAIINSACFDSPGWKSLTFLSLWRTRKGEKLIFLLDFQNPLLLKSTDFKPPSIRLIFCRKQQLKCEFTTHVVFQYQNGCQATNNISFLQISNDWSEWTSAFLHDKPTGLFDFVLIISCGLYVLGSNRSSRYSTTGSRMYAIWTRVTGLKVGNKNLISKIIISSLEWATKSALISAFLCM